MQHIPAIGTPVYVLPTWSRTVMRGVVVNHTRSANHGQRVATVSVPEHASLINVVANDLEIIAKGA